MFAREEKDWVMDFPMQTKSRSMDSSAIPARAPFLILPVARIRSRLVSESPAPVTQGKDWKARKGDIICVHMLCLSAR